MTKPYSGKSHVSIEQYACPICHATYDSGAILIHKRLAQTLDHFTVTGMGGPCPECQARLDDSYVALVVADTLPGVAALGRVHKEHVRRTGEIIWMRRHAADQIFNIPLPGPMAFITSEAAAKIKEMAGSND